MKGKSHLKIVLESSHAFEATTTNDDFLLVWTVNRYWLPMGKKHYRAWRGILWHLLTLFGSSCETGTLSWWSANRQHLPQNPRTTKTKMKKDNFIKLYRNFINLPLSPPSLPIPDGKVVDRSHYVLFICKHETSNQPIFLQISKDCEYSELSTQGYNRIHIILRTCMNESFLLSFSLHFPSLSLHFPCLLKVSTQVVVPYAWGR